MKSKLLLFSLLLLLTVSCKNMKNAQTFTNMTVNAQLMGAKGDGKTDDTKALQKALSSLQAGQTLFIPAGTYLLSRNDSKGSGCLYIDRSNIKIKGELNTIFKLQAKQKDYTRLFHIAWATNVEINSLAFDGSVSVQNNPKNPHEHLHCIFIDSSKDVTITNCKFYDTGGDGVYIHGPKTQSVNVLIDKCSFKGHKRNGVTLGSGFNGVTVNDCHFDASTIKTSPIDSEPENGKCENVIFSNNTIVNRRQDAVIITLGGHVPVRGYQVFNNTLENCGFHLVHAYDVDIYKNNIEVHDKECSGVNVIYVNEDIVIRHNRIRSLGDAVSLIATKVSAPSRIRLEKNELITEGKESFGVRIQGVNDVRVTENKIRNINAEMPESAIFVRSTKPTKDVVISGNEIFNYRNGVSLATYKDYKISNLVFEKNNMSIPTAGEDVFIKNKKNIPQGQIKMKSVSKNVRLPSTRNK